MSKRMKILLLGHDNVGKTTTAKMLNEVYGVSYKDSSMFACEKAVYPHLKSKYGYESIGKCYADRVNHRGEWKSLIREYNNPDAARLAKEITKVCDMYVGMRHPEEYEACLEQNVFDIVFWLDAGSRVDHTNSSMKIKFDHYSMELIPAVTFESTREYIKNLNYLRPKPERGLLNGTKED